MSTRSGSETGASDSEPSPYETRGPIWLTLAVVIAIVAIIGVPSHSIPGAQPTTQRVAPTATVPLTTRQPLPTPEWLSAAKLSIRSFGPIRVGMTLPQANTAAGGPLIDDPAVMGNCFSFTPRGAPSSLRFVVSNGRISRIDVTSPAYASRSGARVGQTEEEVMQLYAGQLEVSAHPPGAPRRTLTLVPKDAADRDHRMVFETDGRRVTSFRAGKLPEVLAPSGCAPEKRR